MRPIRQIVTFMLLTLVPAAALAAPSLTVTPDTLDRFDAGGVELGVTNVGGGAIQVRLLVDVDHDGVADPEDLAIWTSAVVDNTAGWSPNMLADADETAGAITTHPRLFTPFSYPATVGHYLWEVTDLGDLSTATSPFTVTQTGGEQSVSGQVLDDSMVPVGGAMVLMLPLNEECEDVEYTAVADASGNFTVELPGHLDCNYRLVLAAKPGYLSSLLGAPTVVLDGSTAHTGLELHVAAGTQAIGGTLTYSSGPRVGEGIPGSMMFAESDATITIAFTDLSGSYTMMLEDGEWGLEAGEEILLSLQGAVYNEDSAVGFVVSGPGVAPPLTAPAANAFIHGTLYDDAATPRGGQDVTARVSWPCQPDCYTGSIVTATDGSFALGVVAPEGSSVTYYVQAEQPLPGLIAQGFSLFVGAGDELTGQDIEHLTPTAWVRGSFADPEGNALGDLCLSADSWGFDTQYKSHARVGCDGSYELPVVDGYWSVRFNADFLAGFLRGLDTTQVERQLDVSGDLDDVDFIIGRSLDLPTLTSVLPPFGVAGTHVMLRGHAFPQGVEPVVLFDSIPAQVIAARPDQGRIVAEVPAGLDPGVHEVKIQFPDYGIESNSSCFAVEEGSFTPVCTLSGNLTRNLGALKVQGAIVAALYPETEVVARVAVSDANGDWSLELDDDTIPHDLVIIPPAGLPRVWAAYPGLSCPATQNHNFIVGRKLSGQVVTGNGDGLPGVDVLMGQTSTFAAVQTDSGGFYEAQMIQGQTAFIDFTAPVGSRYVNDQATMVTVSGDTVAPTVQFQTGNLFVGRVVDKHGEPLLASIQAGFEVGGFAGYTDSDACTGGFALATHSGQLALGLQPWLLENVSDATEVRWLDQDSDAFSEFDFAVFNDDALQYTDTTPHITDLDDFGQIGQLITVQVENLPETGVEVLFSAAGGGTVPGDGTGWDPLRGLLATRIPSTAVSGNLVVQADGIASEAYPYTIAPGMFDPGSFTLAGTVTASSTPVPGVIVLALQLIPDSESCGEDFDDAILDVSVTDGSGAYALTHPGGDLLVAFLPPVGSTLAPALEFLFAESGDRTDFDQELFGGVPVHVRTVTGDPAEPVPNVLVEIEGAVFEQLLTDANGDATIYLPAGDYGVYLSPPYGSRLLLIESAITAPVDAGDVPLVAGRFVGGRAVDTNDTPVTGAWAEGSRGEEPYEWFFESRSRTNGTWRGPLEGGTPWYVRIEAPTDALADANIFEFDGLQRDLIRYPSEVLWPAGVVEGTVTAAAGGTPLGQIDVAAVSDEGGTPGWQFAWTRTCDDGSYRMKVPAGTHFLAAYTQPMSSYTEGWYSPGTPTDYCSIDAETFTVGEGLTASGIDVALDQRSGIAGNVWLFGSPAAESSVSVTGGRLGSCTAFANTDSEGFYQTEVPAATGYRVEAFAPFGYPGPSQCYDGFDECTDFTPVDAPPLTGVSGIDFYFGTVPREVSPAEPLLRVSRDQFDNVTLTFEKLPPEEQVAGYNIYGGSLVEYGTAIEVRCQIDPMFLTDNFDGTYSDTSIPAPEVQWFLVSASNGGGEGELGNERVLSNACGATGAPPAD